MVLEAGKSGSAILSGAAHPNFVIPSDPSDAASARVAFAAFHVQLPLSETGCQN